MGYLTQWETWATFGAGIACGAAASPVIERIVCFWKDVEIVARNLERKKGPNA